MLIKKAEIIIPILKVEKALSRVIMVIPLKTKDSNAGH